MENKNGLSALLPNYTDSKIKMFRKNIKDNLSQIRNYKKMPRLKILCGKNGGLPFDNIMTDVVSGCLPVGKICYGNCTSAEYWVEKGYDFGKKTINQFVVNDFEASAKLLPKDQKWIRQGWASDCSLFKESWAIAANIAEILAKLDISLLIVTKAYTHPSQEILKILAQHNTEIRTSISAYDAEGDLLKRLNLLNEYRAVGGKSVPYLMSAKYSNALLSKNQDSIVQWIIDNDYIAAEMPLRLNSDNSAFETLAKGGFWFPKFQTQYWFGRIFDKVPNFVLPPLTHLNLEYTLKFKRFSEINGEIVGLDGNLPTFDELCEFNKLGAIDIKHNSNLYRHATYDIKRELMVNA